MIFQIPSAPSLQNSMKGIYATISPFDLANMMMINDK